MAHISLPLPRLPNSVQSSTSSQSMKIVTVSPPASSAPSPPFPFSSTNLNACSSHTKCPPNCLVHCSIPNSLSRHSPPHPR
ncbi:hypothetical protein J010_01812 [Cryptococcus neoformans]|nr:hypothetical protein J010_01812 [Cryptococcus neoformans var. grubii]